MQLFIGIVLFTLTLVAVGLQRAYEHVPPKELRRQARAGDALAQSLYRAVAYGYSLRVVLLTFSITTSAVLYVYIARTIDVWFAAFVIIALLWFFYIWWPAQAVRTWMVRAASAVAPALASILNYLHPLIERVQQFVRMRRPLHFHSGMYEIDDLVELLEKQSQQPDNRIPPETIETVIASLTFADIPVADVLTPRRVVHNVAADESVGPVLLSELHDSGFSRFPVYDGSPDNIVGVLLLRDLIHARKGGKIKTYMKTKVCYVHEEQTLRNALDAVLKTHQQLFIVVNSFEEYVGIISIEDILERVLGQRIVDEFDAYEDMRAVAASQAEAEREEHDHPANNASEDAEVIK